MRSKFPRIVLTGATGGIGRAIAEALDQKDYVLLLTGRDEEKLDQLLASLSGEKHEKVIADLTTDEGIKALKSATANFGVNGLINCLGTNMLATLPSSQDEDITQLIATNLVAPINVCKSLLPLLQRQTNATIVNVGSILGSIGCAGSSIYCASKFGLRGFTESLRRELSDTKVSVIYLAPRATDTALNTHAMNQMNKELGNAIDAPQRVAERLLNALKSGKSANHYVGWPESFFVRLNGLLPTMVDKALSKQLPTIRRFCEMNQTKKING